MHQVTLDWSIGQVKNTQTKLVVREIVMFASSTELCQ